MVAQKRGGFFGGLWKGVQALVKPLLGNVGKIVSGISGGAKRAATQVAHQAITNVAQGSQRALRTGDWKGEAGRAYNSSRREAVGRAQQEYTQGRNEMRERVSGHIRDYQKRFDDRMEKQYSQWRQHPRFEQPRYRQQYGPPPPRQWRGYYGAGFGKAHFKKIEKAAHKHIDKVFAAAHKHTKAQINALKSGTKKGAAKKAAASAIHAAHKEHGGFLKGVIRAVQADMVKRSRKGGGRSVGAGVVTKSMRTAKARAGTPAKGGGRSVGAGRKIGAGSKKKLVPVKKGDVVPLPEKLAKIKPSQGRLWKSNLPPPVKRGRWDGIQDAPRGGKRKRRKRKRKLEEE